MKKVCILSFILLTVLLAAAAPADTTSYEITDTEIHLFYPEKAPTYELDYHYPHITGDDWIPAAVNDTYEQAMNEMKELYLPMLANTPAATGDTLNRMLQSYRVTCNNGRFLSFLFMQLNEINGGTYLSLEGHTFDVSGEYAGDLLTLRGVVMVGDSTVQIAGCMKPVLYEQFVLLQQQGIGAPDITEADFYDMIAPGSDFFTNEDNSVSFYLQPELLLKPSFDVPVFTYTPAELEEIVLSSDNTEN